MSVSSETRNQEMINSKPFAMFFNASPRLGWNAHKM